jgi:hypothetical protein
LLGEGVEHEVCLSGDHVDPQVDVFDSLDEHPGHEMSGRIDLQADCGLRAN